LFILVLIAGPVVPPATMASAPALGSLAVIVTAPGRAGISCKFSRWTTLNMKKFGRWRKILRLDKKLQAKASGAVSKKIHLS
jgi:hypothetical protein